MSVVGLRVLVVLLTVAAVWIIYRLWRNFTRSRVTPDPIHTTQDISQELARLQGNPSPNSEILLSGGAAEDPEPPVDLATVQAEVRRRNLPKGRRRKPAK